MKNKICIVEMSKDQSEIKVKIRQSRTHRNMEITNEIICDYAQQQTAARKTCQHIVWVLLYLLKISENDQFQIAQTDIGVSSFQSLLNELSDSIPNALKIINDGVRKCNQKLRDHEKFYSPQIWYVSRKNIRLSNCSDCLQPKKIMSGDLHFYVEKIFYLEKDGKVIETKFRFCLATSSPTNITSSLNNIKPLKGTTLRYPSLSEISQAELDRIKERGFNIEDIDNISTNSQY